MANKCLTNSTEVLKIRAGFASLYTEDFFRASLMEKGKLLVQVRYEKL